MTDDATPIVRAALGVAIAQCHAAWQKKWKRAPTLNELTHALEICVEADEIMADAPPPRPPRAIPPVDPESFDVVFRDTGAFGVPEAELYLPNAKKDVGAGEVRALLEARDGTLVIDVHFDAYRAVPTFALACGLVRARVLHRFIGRRDLDVTRIIMRPLRGIEAAVDTPWPDS